MIRVPASVRRSFSLPIAPEAALDLMRDVPSWAMLFPHVATVRPLAEGVWRWEMEPLGPPGMEAHTAYACRYHFDADALTVTWTPEAGVGNATFAGGVTFAAAASGGTTGDLWLDATLEIPAPRFMSGIVRPAVGLEFGRMTDRFLKRLRESIGS